MEVKVVRLSGLEEAPSGDERLGLMIPDGEGLALPGTLIITAETGAVSVEPVTNPVVVNVE